MANKYAALLIGGFLLLAGTAPLGADADVKEFGDYAFLRQYKSIEVSRIKDGTATIIGNPCYNCARKIVTKNIKKLRY